VKVTPVQLETAASFCVGRVSHSTCIVCHKPIWKGRQGYWHHEILTVVPHIHPAVPVPEGVIYPKEEESAP